ncbi:MAG: diguanylate cyclase domain-containing protein [Limnochordia bacterium]
MTKQLVHALRILTIIIVFIGLWFVLYSHHQRTVAIIYSNHAARQELVETNIYNTVRYADYIAYVLEEALNYRMEDASLFLRNYYRENPQVMEWDLEALKSQLGDYEIYIIDENLQVIRTTFLTDLGLDFSYMTSFARMLRERLAAGEFVADRLDVSTLTGKMLKYSYMPTPDGRYLLELSIDMEERFPILRELNTFELAEELKRQYSSVADIRRYKMAIGGRGILQVSNSSPFYRVLDDEEKKKVVAEAFASGENQLWSDYGGKDGHYTAKYIPYIAYDPEGNYLWWNSYVIEIIYDETPLLADIASQAAIFRHTGLVMAIIYFGLSFGALYLLEKSEQAAYHDHLTGLLNRKGLEKFLDRKLIPKGRRRMALLFLDLDDFKQINDHLGHNVGDGVLQVVGERLRSNLRQEDSIARLGGDEFVIVLDNISDREQAENIAAKLTTIISQPIMVNKQQITVTCSIGVSLYPDDGLDLSRLLHLADAAMYRAKERGHPPPQTSS